MVELHLAKVDVAGSSPVFRLNDEPEMVHFFFRKMGNCEVYAESLMIRDSAFAFYLVFL